MHIVCRVLERISRTHHYELWTGDQLMGFENTVNTGFRDKVLMGIGEMPGQFPGCQFRLIQGHLNALMKAAGSIGRHQHRDRTLVLMMYRHGLRVSEAINLKWDQVDFKAGTITVNRLKRGKTSTHPLQGDVIRALRRVKRELSSRHFIFVSERGGTLTRSTVNKLITRAGQIAKFDFPAHPHMLRHACGYYLANKSIDTRTIQDYLGHVSITHTVRYTELSPHKFNGLWS